MKKTLLSLLLLSTLVFQSYAQRFNYESTSKFFVGFQLGYNWHTTDVLQVKPSIKFPIGVGFMLGGSLNQDYGRFLSYDIRAKFYFGKWYGVDMDTTNAIEHNPAVNNLYKSLGYTVQNFSATQFHSALELALHFNRVKERTGIDPYIFGGIGLTFTNTRGNLTNKAHSIYAYNKTPNGTILDDSYESKLVKNSKGEFYNDHSQVNFLPSLGFGIGYYFNDRFSLGFEHTTTFFLGDYLDGTTTTQDGKASHPFKNDLYHFTSIYFRWYFKRHTSTSNNIETNTPPIDRANPSDYTNSSENEPVENDRTSNQNSSDVPRVFPPQVDFINPSDPTFTTNQPTFTLRATIKNVENQRNVSLVQNARVAPPFIFKPFTDQFESTVTLQPGKNTFVLKGSNASGNDKDVVTIVYVKSPTESVQPPVINIVTPSSSPFTTNQINTIVEAMIYNIQHRNQLVVTFNNQQVNTFSYSTREGVNFSINLPLNPGINRLKIQGTNEAGKAEDETVIIYSRSTTENIAPPTVDILTPSISPLQTQQNNVQVVAKVKNITSKNQLHVQLNNISTTNFSFNSSQQKVVFNTNLYEGTNTVRIRAENPYGSDVDQTQIIYKKTQPRPLELKPTVEITSPSVNPLTINDNSIHVVAKTTNISTRNQIAVNVNGTSITNFIFKKSDQQISFNAPIAEGSNIVNVQVTNTYGSASDQTKVIRKKRGYPPTIQIVTPNKNPYTTNKLNENIVAEVSQITGKNQLVVKVNGNKVYNFSYNPSTQRVQLSANLSASGSNVIQIIGTNAYGSSSDAVTINYQRAPVHTTPKPVISYILPNKPGKSVFGSSYTMKAKVNNVTSKQFIHLYVGNQLIPQSNYTYQLASGILTYPSELQEGLTTFTIKAQNNGGTAEASTNIKYVKLTTEKKPTGKKKKLPTLTCGTVLDLSGKNPEFCIHKQGGEVLADYLKTYQDYTYKGPAKAVYFKAAENGNYTLNNKKYSTIKGNYYLFYGVTEIDIKYNRAGHEGKWSVCIIASRAPTYGDGIKLKKPDYPCLKTSNTSNDDKSDEGSDDKIIRKPTINNSSTPVIKTTTKPSTKTGLNTRKVRTPTLER